MIVPDKPAGFFIVEFVEIFRSTYASTYSFCTGRSQEDIVCSRLDDPDSMYQYQMLRDECEGEYYRIYDQNPLHLGFFLNVIRQEGNM